MYHPGSRQRWCGRRGPSAGWAHRSLHRPGQSQALESPTGMWSTCLTQQFHRQRATGPRRDTRDGNRGHLTSWKVTALVGPWDTQADRHYLQRWPLPARLALKEGERLLREASGQVGSVLAHFLRVVRGTPRTGHGGGWGRYMPSRGRGKLFAVTHSCHGNHTVASSTSVRVSPGLPDPGQTLTSHHRPRVSHSGCKI